MSELYRFEFGGAEFAVDLQNADEAGTTTTPPNVRVMEGSWPTWHLSVPDGKVPGLAGIRLRRSVGADGGPHPNGNQTPEQSGPHGYMMMAAAPTGNSVTVPGPGGDIEIDGGETYRVASGWGVVSRFYTDEEWSRIVANWEGWVRAQGASSVPGSSLGA